ncbi:hypothetical protein ERO13_D11G281650v2 [Gossypium hirsutum]|nr:hypothetical protein ERO13_D11G281650v2 [Gossypium hirsutum]
MGFFFPLDADSGSIILHNNTLETNHPVRILLCMMFPMDSEEFRTLPHPSYPCQIRGGVYGFMERTR